MPRGDHGGTSKGTGVRCVAANCGNTNADGVSLHYFPRDPTRRKRWTDFVQVKRVWGGTTQYSALCSKHFTEDCIPFKYKFQMEQMGTKPKRLQLTDDAVPTIHVETITTPSPARRMPKLSLLSPHEELACQRSPPKKLRRGYLKRETARIIAAHENEDLSQKERETYHEAMQLEEFDREINTSSTASVCCQAKPEQASKKCQTRNKMETKSKLVSRVTKVFEKLDDIISSRQMKRDIPMLSGCHQTSALEGYHSVINHFAPKMIGFSYHGMLSRLWVAALHFNENAQREQAYTAEGQPRYKITFPKFKRGEYTVRKTPVESTYEYVEVLMRTAIGLGRISHMNRDGFQLQVQVPPSLSSEYERPDHQMAVRSLLSRFNETQQHGSPCMSG